MFNAVELWRQRESSESYQTRYKAQKHIINLLHNTYYIEIHTGTCIYMTK